MKIIEGGQPTVKEPTLIHKRKFIELRPAPGQYSTGTGGQNSTGANSDALQNQVYLGDENFVQRMQAQMQTHQQHDKQIPKTQRRSPQSWSAWLAQCQGDRDQALYLAYQQGGMTMSQLGTEAGLSVSHVSRLIAKGEKAKWEG